MSTQTNTGEMAPYVYRLGTLRFAAYLLEAPSMHVQLPDGPIIANPAYRLGYVSVAISNFGHWSPRIVRASALQKVSHD